MAMIKVFEAALLNPPGPLGLTKTGSPVVSMRVVERDRIPDGNGGYTDRKPPFYFDVECYGDLAVHVAASPWRKGQWIILIGHLRVEHWEDKSNTRRETIKLVATTLAPDMRQDGNAVQAFIPRGQVRSQQAPASSPPPAQSPWTAGPPQPSWPQSQPPQGTHGADQNSPWGSEPQPGQTPQQTAGEGWGPGGDPWGPQPGTPAPGWPVGTAR